tara:strand:- start:577 stop:792 length:216 start_codon:yes stop_codon:yes gene_type:complete
MYNFYKDPITEGEIRLEKFLSLVDELGINYEELFYDVGRSLGGWKFQEWAEGYIEEYEFEKYMLEETAHEI